LAVKESGKAEPANAILPVHSKKDRRFIELFIVLLI
jgi:hypothetical protein